MYATVMHVFAGIRVKYYAKLLLLFKACSKLTLSIWNDTIKLNILQGKIAQILF